MSAVKKERLEILYVKRKKSVAQIARQLECSENKVNYWLKKHGIAKRSISEAVYVRANPHGDPFTPANPKTMTDAFLYGLGVGLYWGEGTKANKHTVRLGNTDPKLIKKFIEFLEYTYGVERSRLRFGLQIFSDMSETAAVRFWKRELNISKRQFMKVVVTGAQSIGTYRHKTRYGVLTVYFNNKKLRDEVCETIEKL